MRVLTEGWQMAVAGVSSFRRPQLPGLRSPSLSLALPPLPKLSPENEGVGVCSDSVCTQRGHFPALRSDTFGSSGQG